MANWAALQEQLIDKPVFKRAKHGIHFKQAGGSILANFSGKPCHYFDGKLWKPIDTKPVLRKDGWYGCPHSDVIIHPDGTVKVGEYAQKATLILAKEGKVDGDCIIREFDGGRQIMRITENGFRQEIVLEKCPDLAKASALLDTVSGVLPSKYTASALSAKDSTTAELADSVSLDSKTLVEYLEKAKYPVVIDPDFTVQPDATDGKDTAIYSAVNTYNYGTSAFLSHGNVSAAGENIRRSLFYFDVSSISASATVSAASLTLYAYGVDESGGNYDSNLYRVLTTWTEGTRSGAADSPATGATWVRRTVSDNWATAGCGNTTNDREPTSIGSATWNDSEAAGVSHAYTLTASAIEDWIDGTLTNNGLILVGDEGETRGFYSCSSDHGTSGYRPVLTVTYSAAASLHTLSLLGVGK